MNRCGSLLSFRRPWSTGNAGQSGTGKDRQVPGSSGRTTFLSPSVIHHIRSEHLLGQTLANDVVEIDDEYENDAVRRCYGSDERTSGAGAVAPRELKIQAVHNDGCWFALDSAQLELCRRLERRGLCRQVRVDIVPTREIPARLRCLMTRPTSPPPPAPSPLQSSTPTPADTMRSYCHVISAGKDNVSVKDPSPVMWAEVDPSALSGTCCSTWTTGVSAACTRSVDEANCDKISMGGSLPHASCSSATAAASTASAAPAYRRTSHVSNGYRKLEQEDDSEMVSTASNTDDDDESDTDDDGSDVINGSDEFDSDFEASGDDVCDDGSFYGSDAEWFEGSASDDNLSEAAPSGDEKECLL